MASWQAYVFSTLLKYTFKPKLKGARDVARVRRVMSPRPFALPLGVRLTPGEVGGVAGEWAESDDASRGLLLYIHGGGFVACSSETHRPITSYLAKLGFRVFAPDYRLAPETQFPGAIEDCYAALSWLHQNASALGVDRTRIVIGGESAGGGIAAALAILARDRGNIPLAYQLLIYPMLDDRTCVMSDHPHVGHFVWTQANNRFGWNSYLGQPPGGEDVGAYSAAARCDDLAGLPPAFLAAGSLDLFLEEDIDYARRLIRAGVPAELHIYPGAFHAFDLIADAGVSKAFRRDWQNALEKAFSR